MLNPIIRGWANYHQNQVAKDTFQKVDHFIWQQLWKWACRRHPNKSRKWVKKRYFIRDGGRNWTFSTKINKGGKETRIFLVHAGNTPIRRHRKIRSDANPFNPAWSEYFEDRLGWGHGTGFEGTEATASPLARTGREMSAMPGADYEG